MNTVLDDNKMLCLAYSERIKLSGTMCMMFEVNDLAVASPATVSRCGMVYLEYVHMPWPHLIATWKEQNAEELPSFFENISSWVQLVSDSALPFIRDECQESIASTNHNLVTSFLKLVNTYVCLRNGIPRTSDETKSNKSEQQQDKLV